MNLVCCDLLETYSSTCKNLLINKWCRSNISNNFRYEIADINKFDIDKSIAQVEFLKLIEKEIYLEIIPQLNEIHKKNYSLFEWTIILGYWLRRFLNIVYFKKTNLDEVFKNFKIKTFIKIEDKNHNLNSEDTLSSSIIHLDSIKNNYYYYELLKFFYKDRIKFIYSNQNINIHKVNAKNLKLSYRSKFLKNVLIRKDEPVISHTGLNKINEFFLSHKFNKLPRFWSEPKFIYSRTDITLRHEISKNFCKEFPDKNFKSFILKKFYYFIPNAFLEDFEKLDELSKKIYPQRSKFVFTANMQGYSEIFKCFLARISKQKKKIFIGQHGCNYGVSKIINNNSIDEKISTKFFTYGWKYEDKHLPGVIQNSKIEIINFSSKKIGLIMCGHSGEFHFFNAYDELDVHNAKMKKFIKFLPIEVQNQLLIKLHPRGDRINNENKKNFSNFLNITNQNIILSQENNINTVRKQSRLMIHGYEGTSFYEDIGKNNPSFLILKHGYKIIRDEALSMFRLLEQIGIAHYDEQESAKIITDVSNDISYWWRDRARQKSLVKFRDKYCRTAMHPEKLLFKFINQNL